MSLLLHSHSVVAAIFTLILHHRVFAQRSRESSALGGNTASAKEFIEFVVQLIPGRPAGVESGVRSGGMERVRRTGREG